MFQANSDFHGYARVAAHHSSQSAIIVNCMRLIILAPVLLSAVLFLYFPSLVYHENADFFESSFRYIAVLLLSGFVSTAFLIWLPTLFMRARWKERYAVVIASLALTGWFIGVFLVFNTGLLDGQQPLRSMPSSYQWAELGGAIVVLAGLVVAGWKWPRVAGNVTLFLTLVTGALFLINVVGDRKKYDFGIATESMLRASAEKNVFVFVFDTFQSDVFEAILEENRSLYNDLDGFTFFKNTASVAPTTYLSMPAIHSGSMYEQDQSIPDYYEQSIRKNSFLTRLSAAGYETSMINSVGPCPDGTSCGMLGLVTKTSWTPVIRDASLLTDISLYRFVPALFKPAVYNGGRWRISDLAKVHRITANVDFLNDLGNRLFPVTNRPVARLIHLYITHPPALVNAACRSIAPQKWRWEPVKAQSHCAVNLFVNFLRTLKEKKLYDRSVIVLLSDHGAGLIRKEETRIMAKARALLLIKPMQAKGPLKIGHQLLHVGDLPKTVCRLTGDCEFDQGVFAFEPDKGSRKITFLEYRWKHEYWRSKSVPIDAYWNITGPVDNIFSWYKQIAPQKLNVSHLDFSRNDPDDSIGYGWSRPEKRENRNFRLAEQSLAQVFLPLKPGADVRIDLTVAAKKPATIVLFVDDTRVGELPLPAGWQLISFEIPGASVVNPVSRLTFQLNKNGVVKTKSPRTSAVAFDRLDIVYR